MKTLRKMTAAALLACVFALSVHAGDMWAGYTPPPPPPPDTTPATSGDEVGVTLMSDEASEGLAETALTLLQSALSVF